MPQARKQLNPPKLENKSKLGFYQFHPELSKQGVWSWETDPKAFSLVSRCETLLL